MINGGSNKDKRKRKTYRTSPPRQDLLSVIIIYTLNVIIVID